MNFRWDNIKNVLIEERKELPVGIELAAWKIPKNVVIQGVMMMRGGRGLLFICSFYMLQTGMEFRTPGCFHFRFSSDLVCLCDIALQLCLQICKFLLERTCCLCACMSTCHCTWHTRCNPVNSASTTLLLNSGWDLYLEGFWIKVSCQEVLSKSLFKTNPTETQKIRSFLAARVSLLWVLVPWSS